MPTENRRIATYFPKDIDDRFSAFKLKRGIRGDSQALLTIVSEFFEVTQEVAHFSSPDLLDRFESLEKVVFQIQQELGQIRSVTESSYEQEIQESLEQVISVVPGQLNLLEPGIKPSDPVALLSELISEPLFCLTGSELSKRLGLSSKVLSDRRRKRTNAVFIEWSKMIDPDGIGWQYDSEKKAYFSIHPVQETPADCQDF